MLQVQWVMASFRCYDNSDVIATLIMTSSETQGQIVGARESLNGRENMARRKVKNGENSPLGLRGCDYDKFSSLPNTTVVAIFCKCLFVAT